MKNKMTSLKTNPIMDECRKLITPEIKALEYAEDESSLFMPWVDGSNVGLVFDDDDTDSLDIVKYNLQQAFIAGYNEALRWRVIERDEDGYAKEECLEEIFSHSQVLLLLEDNSVDVIAQNHDKVDWKGDIDRKPCYTKWRPIEPPSSDHIADGGKMIEH